MQLTFAGTRGETAIRSTLHGMHSSCRLEQSGHSLVIDWGTDWRGRAQELDADALLLTHAHPDHAGGLRDGLTCPVFATKETWDRLPRAPVADKRLVVPRKPFELGQLIVEAFPVVHSLRAPAVGYRISSSEANVFYVPDLVEIEDRACALQTLSLYVGDGATLTRPIIRRRYDTLIGHTSIRAQLRWCNESAVPRAVFTHCGSALIRGGASAASRVVTMGHEFGVEALVASDGSSVELAARPGCALGSE